MKYIFSILLFTQYCNATLLNTTNKRYPQKNPRDLTVSLIIPCDPKHAIHLHPLLRSYEHQTVLADEIVISLSEIHDVPIEIIETIRNTSWSFPVTLLCSKQRHFAGSNRNRACAQAVGDILLCQDADDLAHPQRVEIIKYFFEHHDIVFLMHTCKLIYKHGPTEHLFYNDFSKIQYLIPEHFNQVWRLSTYHNRQLSTCVHNGNIAITKELFQKIQWPANRKGQDVEFNKMIFKKYKNRCVIKAPLIFYRNFLSSWGDYYSSSNLKIDFDQTNPSLKKPYKTKIIYND